MVLYILKRILQIVGVLFLSSIIVFTVIRLAPGDPAIRRLGVRAKDPRLEETLKTIREEMNIDKPIYVQYGIWLSKVVRLDFGVSYRNQEPVIDIIRRKIFPSVELVLGGVTIGVIVAMILGISSALFHRSAWDRFVQLTSQLGYAIPVFWLGLLMIIVFSLNLKLLPPGGYVPFAENPGENLKRLIMPSLSFAVYEIAVFTRYLRSETLEVKRQDYVRVAKSKGLSNWLVIRRHIVRNSLIPFTTVLGLELGALIGNTVITEQVFGWPGIGWLLFNAISNRDYALVQGIVLLIAFSFAAINLVVDILYTFLNPRIRYIRR